MPLRPMWWSRMPPVRTKWWSACTTPSTPKNCTSADEVKALFARNARCAAGLRGIASAGSLLLDSRRAEACSANFEKKSAATSSDCARLLPRTEAPPAKSCGCSAITPKGEVFYQGTAQALADKFIVFRDEYGAVSRLLLELIRAEALARGYHIITCPCAMHPDDKIDHLFIPSLRLAFLTDNRWHPVQLPGVQAVRCSRFVDRENLSAYRARLRASTSGRRRTAGTGLCPDGTGQELPRRVGDLLPHRRRLCLKVDAAAAQCMELFGVG